MNENIDLTKILKECPEGFKLYSTIHGPVTFVALDLEKDHKSQIIIQSCPNGIIDSFTKEGKFFTRYRDAECCLFPSKDQRDWSKFTAPWYKKDKFDPKTLKPFDKVLLKNENNKWNCAFVSHIESERIYLTTGGYICGFVLYCIPYNDDTKHLVGTADEAPEYYRYWED